MSGGDGEINGSSLDSKRYPDDQNVGSGSGVVITCECLAGHA